MRKVSTAAAVVPAEHGELRRGGVPGGIGPVKARKLTVGDFAALVE